MPPLLKAVVAAENRTAELGVAGDWAHTVESLVVAARAIGIRSLYAASPAGERLVGGMTLADPEFAVWRIGEDVRVLLVDAFLAGSAGIDIAGARARASGARQVEALVLGLSGPNAAAESEIPIHLLGETSL
jgi:hypothetical protein